MKYHFIAPLILLTISAVGCSEQHDNPHATDYRAVIVESGRSNEIVAKADANRTPIEVDFAKVRIFRAQKKYIVVDYPAPNEMFRRLRSQQGEFILEVTDLAMSAHEHQGFIRSSDIKLKDEN